MNDLNKNPMILDTFSVDFAIGGPITLTKVVFLSATATDKFSLLHGTNDNAPEGLRIKQNSDLRAEQTFTPPMIFPNGLFFDASQFNTGLDDGTDRVLIYLK